MYIIQKESMYWICSFFEMRGHRRRDQTLNWCASDSVQLSPCVFYHDNDFSVMEISAYQYCDHITQLV